MSRTNFGSNIRTKASKQLDPIERKSNLVIDRSSSHPREKSKDKVIKAPQNLYKVMHPYNRQRIKLPPPLSINQRGYHLQEKQILQCNSSLNDVQVEQLDDVVANLGSVPQSTKENLTDK